MSNAAGGLGLKGRKVVIKQAYSCEYETTEWTPSDIPEGHILIRTEYSLISPGTELAFYTGTHIDLNNPSNRWAKFPFYPGYASVGEVIAIGDKINQVQVGQKVLALGHHASYDVIYYSDDYIVPLPDHVDPKHALFARLAEISSSALIQSKFSAGIHVAIIGMGLIGNLAAQLYTLQGAHTIGIDVDEERLSIAKATNVTSTILSGEFIDVSAAIKELTGGGEPDIVVEATGSPALVNTALEAVRSHGQVILLGSPRGTAEIDIYRHIHKKAVSLIGAHGSIKGIDGLPSTAQLLRYVLKLISNGSLIINPLITHILPADQAERGYQLLLNKNEGALGVILDWTTHG